MFLSVETLILLSPSLVGGTVYLISGALERPRGAIWTCDKKSPVRARLARIVLFTFVLTFTLSRIVVLLIMTGRLPDLYLYMGGNHIHHLNYGIFLLSGLGAYLLFVRPAGRALSIAAIVYGVGLALTFDEFGMWLHLGGSYWQRASWDALAILTAVLALCAFAPSLRQFRVRHGWATVVLLIALATFGYLLHASLRYAERISLPKLIQIESTAPR